MASEAETIGVGIVGLSAGGGWAGRGHLPALEAVPGFRLAALSASSAASAAAAGERYGVPLAFGSAAELAACPDVDLVVVSVQAARHAPAVAAAIDAGKHVYCEWPLAVTAAEASELVAAARDRGVRGFVGLQARSAPVIRYVRDLVKAGWVGEVLSTTLVASGMSWGKESDSRTSYLLDRDGGSTMLSIPFGHVVDAVQLCLGEFTEVGAVLANRRPYVRDSASGEFVPKTADDQVAVHGVLETGAVAVVHFRGGRSRGTNFRWEINGSDGDLVLEGPHGHLQLAPVMLHGTRRGEGELTAMPVPAEYHRVSLSREQPGNPSANLANAYAALLGDLRENTAEIPDFAHGVRHHRLIEAILRADATGQRASL
ncbi:Gfo/Idh/MocA family oxidoreductase [Amycolatopsis sp. K13G38]|uniref:Gfo/Idh/MocA family oxidoreductase n=1 Tax=Amycolatopsis acididurans TaxID=2724524 RepID=A0ABX1J3D1_9PSEU|nr:Gfo/Idh/MocA family oxidoreductase [Amycolatopsis acididurans]NKQ54291.1 Gfo/Idh/MocA family oxidoreductase [Amycolatopsis acididurans]